MDNKDKLLAIFNDDPHGLLEVKAKASPVQNEDHRLLSSFEEINDFIDRNGREPERNMSDMHEMKLYSRLKGIREHNKKVEALQNHDKHKLLTVEEELEVNSVDDILNTDAFGVLDDEEDIFTLKHVSDTQLKKSDPDFIAQREPCEEFEKYEDLFKECHKDLKEGRRRLVPSIESQLHEGNFCVLDGLLLYIAKIYHPQRGNSGKINRRTLLIFENGTQSNMLLRSLGKRLKDNGKMVTTREGDELAGFNQITDEDEASGYIYILKSQSENDHIKTMKNLYKIGFSKTDVKERIKNAKNEPTYLMAPVTLVGAYQCFNMNPQKLEQLLHRFFGNSCLNIDIFDQEGNRYTPREWFIAPLEVIEDAIRLILSGEIVNHYYDNRAETIIAKE